MTDREDEALAGLRVAASAQTTARCSGSLAELAVADVVQLLQLIGKSAVMTVTVAHHGGQSRLWCAEGSMVDAESGRLRGEAAVYRILSLDEGWLEAELRHEERPRTIYAPTQRLLLEAARRADETLALKSKLGGVRCCYRLVREPEPEQVASPTAGELRLLQQLSATASVEELLAESELGDLETLVALERWFEAGHLAKVGLRAEGSTRTVAADELDGAVAPQAHAGTATASAPPLATSVRPLARSKSGRSLPGKGRLRGLAAGAAALLAVISFVGGYLLRGGAAVPATSTASPQSHASEPIATAGAAAAPGNAENGAASTAGASPPGAALGATTPGDGAGQEPPAPPVVEAAELDGAPPVLNGAPPELDGAPRVLDVGAITAPARQAVPPESHERSARSTTAKPAARLGSGRTRAAGASPVVSEPRVRVIGATEPSVRLLD